VTTSGGVPVAGIGNSPSAEGIAWLPRPAQISSSATANSAGTIYDGGLFESAPAAAVVPGIGATSTIATVALTMGSFYDIAVVQPAP
jgi:hypothetical protein